MARCRRPSPGARGCSSAGRAREWHSRGQGFDPPQLHKAFHRWWKAFFFPNSSSILPLAYQTSQGDVVCGVSGVFSGVRFSDHQSPRTTGIARVEASSPIPFRIRRMYGPLLTLAAVALTGTAVRLPLALQPYPGAKIRPEGITDRDDNAEVSRGEEGFDAKATAT